MSLKMKLNGIISCTYFTRMRRDFDECEMTHFILSFLFEKSEELEGKEAGKKSLDGGD